MTMTPDQEARVRDFMLTAISEAKAGHYNRAMELIGDAMSALAALDGEAPQEEWTACRYVINGFTRCWSIRDAVTKDAIAGALTEANARRVARLPKLERAAREVQRQSFRSERGDWQVSHSAFTALSTAINDEPKP
jgi:hypothetical protein